MPMRKGRTLRDKIRLLRAKFKHVSEHRFFYNNGKDLKRSYRKICSWFLIHDEARGYSIMPLEFKRLVSMNVQEWIRLFQYPSKKYDPLFEIFVQKILPAINNKSGGSAHWRFKALVGWTGIHDLQQGRDTRKRSSRHKTFKKRVSHARHSNRD
jgi:hypothetical protein